MLIFVSNCSVLSEISIFRRNFQMVTCTISCTCKDLGRISILAVFLKFLGMHINISQ